MNLFRRAHAAFLWATVAGSLAGTASAEVPVRGVVVDADGRPVAEAVVELLAPAKPGDALSGSRDRRIAARATTAPDGRFRIAAPEPGVWDLGVRAEGFAPVERRISPLVESIDLPAATLSRDPGFTVTVRDPEGGPVAGATVRVADHESRFPGDSPEWKPVAFTLAAGDDGKAVLPRRPGNRGFVSASSPGRPVVVLEGARGDAAALRLLPSESASIDVREPSGGAVSGAVVLDRATDHPLAVTDASGAVAVPLGASASASVRVVSPDGRSFAGSLSRPDPADPRPLTIRLPARSTAGGRVIDAETRRAVAGALVWDEGDPWRQAVADGNGRFVLDGQQGERMRLRVAAAGYLPSPAMEVDLATERARALALVLDPAASVSGTVVDSEGRPLAGATVQVEKRRHPGRIEIVIGGQTEAPRATTDDGGAFRLRGIAPGPAWDLVAHAEGFAEARQALPDLPARGEQTGVRVSMSRGGTIAGTAVDADGSPVRGAEVSVRPARPARTFGGMAMIAGGPGDEPSGAVTGEDGTFAVDGLPGGLWDVSFRRAGFARKTVSGIEVPQGGDPVDLGEVALDPGEMIQGLVVGPDGSPVAGASIAATAVGTGPRMVVGGPGAAPGEPDATTGPDGWFVVDGLEAGTPVSLRVSRKGFRAATHPAVEPPAPEPVEVRLTPSSVVSGTVVTTDGKPLPRAGVTMTRTQDGGGGGERFRFIMREGTAADDDGRFRFEDVDPGTVSLEATAAGMRSAKLDAVRVPEGEDVDVRLPLDFGAWVEGRVVGPDGRAAIGARVAEVKEGSTEPFRLDGAVTDGDGRFRLDGLAPGRVSIEATHEGYERVVKDVDASEGPNRLDLRFEGGQPVSGLVLDRAGAPVPGAWVRLAPAGERWGGPEGATDGQGLFRFEGVADGTWEVLVDRDGFAASEGDVRIEVAGAPVEGVEVRLDPGAAIAGRIAGIDPANLPAVEVLAVSGAGGFPRFGSVDRSGGYRVADVGPGEWEVRARHAASGRQARGRTTIETGSATASLDLRFESGVELTGRALQGDRPVVDATVYALGLDVERSGEGRVDADGSFAVSGLVPGTYRVELRQWSTGLAYDEAVELAASREIVLRVPTALVSGRIVDASDRSPLQGVRVELTDPDADARAPATIPKAATTDLEGRFRIPNVGDGAWSVVATRTGYAATNAVAVVRNGRPESEIDLALDPTEGVVLDVILPTGRQPDQVQAAAIDASGLPVVSGRFATGEGGRVRLSSVPPGAWRVLLQAAGTATTAVDVRAPSEPVAVSLPPACALSVEVPELRGGDAAASARLEGAEGATYRWLDWSGAARTGWRMFGGRLDLADVPPGRWRVVVEAADGRSWTGTATTGSGTPARLVLE